MSGRPEAQNAGTAWRDLPELETSATVPAWVSAPVPNKPFMINGYLACGAEVDGGRCGRAPGHGADHPHIRDEADRPAALAWTPERATRRAILRTYAGRLLLCDRDHFALRFPNMAAAVVWAEATDMVARVKVVTPTNELPLNSAIMVRLDIREPEPTHFTDSGVEGLRHPKERRP